ncbi:MAG: RDD family protein [Patulibacter minatonensis]
MPLRPTDLHARLLHAPDGLPGIPGAGPSGIPGLGPSGIPGAPAGGISFDKPTPQAPQDPHEAQHPQPGATFELAGWGPRFGAFLLDALLLYAIIGAVVGIVFGVAAASEGAAVLVAIVLVLPTLAALVLLIPWYMSRNQGSSPGKKALGIRVVREDGTDVDLGFAVMREFLIKGLAVSVVGGLTFYIGLIANYLWPVWDAENRAVHDMMAKSRVVRR